MALPLYSYSVAASYLIPATAGIVRYKLIERPMRLLAILCGLAVAQVASQLVIGYVRHGSNYFLSTYFWLVELLLLAAIYSMALRSPWRRLAVRAMSLCFACYWLVDVLVFDDPNLINVRIAVLSRVFLIAMSLLTLHERLATHATPPATQGLFWLTVAVMIYSSGTVVLLGASNELRKLGADYFLVAWNINWGLTIVSNLLLFQALRCKVA